MKVIGFSNAGHFVCVLTEEEVSHLRSLGEGSVTSPERIAYVEPQPPVANPASTRCLRVRQQPAPQAGVLATRKAASRRMQAQSPATEAKEDPAQIAAWYSQFVRDLSALQLDPRVSKAVGRYAFDFPRMFQDDTGHFMDCATWSTTVLSGGWTNRKIRGLPIKDLRSALARQSALSL